MDTITIVQIMAFDRALSNCVDARFTQIEFNEFASIATYLDPHF